MKKPLILFCAGAALFAAGAADFPAAVDGTITLDLAEGVTNTYSAALPAATAFVKTGPGCAILTAATTAFTGSVDVREGTLTIQDGAALGENTPISVTGDAATLNCNFARPSGSGQWTCFFSGHNVTIRGQGVDGKGAFRYTALDSKVCDDNMLESLTLSDDAYIGIPSRWGIQKALNLNGHTLTRIDGTGTWMWFNPGATIDAGVISNVVGTITAQHVPQFTDPTNTTIYMAGGRLGFWYAQPAISCRVVMCGGTFEGRGSGTRDSILSGPVDFTRNIWTGLGTGYRMEITGPTTVASGVTEFRWNTKSSLYLNGPVVVSNSSASMRIQGGGRLVCSSNVTRRVGNLVLADTDSRVDLEAGTLECRGILRNANGWAPRTGMFQSGGDFSVVGDSYIGEGGTSYGVHQMSGGTATFSNVVNVGYWPNSEGLIVQTGGTMRMVRRDDWSCVRMPAGRALIAVLDNATNDTRANWYGGTTRLRLGWANTTPPSEGQSNLYLQHGGRGTLAVRGAHAVVTTESLVMGTTDTATTNLVAVTEGGTLKARRFYCEEAQHAEALNEVYVDGGVVMPTFPWGWNHKGYDATNFYARSPHIWSIGPKGMVVDTSEEDGNNKEQSVSGWGNGSFWAHALSDATGQGIASIALPTDDADFAALAYRGPVFVDIEGPGHGASAFAAFDPDTRKLTGVVVLAAGSDYDETTRVYVRHPGATGRTECTYTLTGPRAGGSLIKRGAYHLVLFGTNTYTGGTIVEGGTLAMGTAVAFPSNTPLTVKTGGAFDAGGFDLAVSWLGGMGGTISNVKDNALTVSAGLSLTAADVFAEGAAPLTVNGKVTFAEGAALRVVDPENLAAHRKGASVAFLKASGGFAGAVPRLDLADDTGTRWTTFARGNALYLSPVNGTVFILR